MRIIKLQQTNIPQPQSVTNINQRDVSGLIQSLLNTVPELASLKNNPAMSKALATFLGPIADKSEDVNTILPKIRTFLQKQDATKAGETSETSSSVRTTSTVSEGVGAVPSH